MRNFITFLFAALAVLFAPVAMAAAPAPTYSKAWREWNNTIVVPAQQASTAAALRSKTCASQLGASNYQLVLAVDAAGKAADAGDNPGFSAGKQRAAAIMQEQARIISGC